jgi:hypothetical protein
MVGAHVAEYLDDSIFTDWFPFSDETAAEASPYETTGRAKLCRSHSDVDAVIVLVR